MNRTSLAPLALGVLLSGCYHAAVVSGRTPSPQTMEDRWADSFVGGLVPPDEIDASQRCPAGIARVETKLSFLNMLVGALTLSIYTPMDIRVTCAASQEQDASLAAPDQVDGALLVAQTDAEVEAAAPAR